MSTIKVKVNGKLVEAKVEGNMRLLDLVRDTLHLTATKEGCSIGECGACTVLM
ncbi:2Fe-2S iron-sulfur cluster-binding protein, partial [Klebsiella aerogenes]